jgi:hypothetical protein
MKNVINELHMNSLKWFGHIYGMNEYRLPEELVNLESMRAVRKVTSRELLTKQAMRKKSLYTNNVYILKLLLSVVTA